MKVLVFIAFLVTITCVQSAVLDGIIQGCTGCSVKGACYFPNQEWKQGCWTKKCVVTANGNGWKTPVVNTQCPDTYGRCIDHGQKASNGCRCQVDGLHWSYTCHGK